METIVEKNIIEPLQTVISIRVTRFRTIIHRMCIESSMLKFWANNRFKESYAPLSIYHLFLPVYSKKEKGTMINVPAQSLCQLIPKPLIPSSRYTIQGYIRLRHRHAHSREFQWPRFPVPFQIGKDGKSPKFELKNKEEKRERRKKKRKKRKKNAPTDLVGPTSTVESDNSADVNRPARLWGRACNCMPARNWFAFSVTRKGKGGEGGGEENPSALSQIYRQGGRLAGGEGC